MAEAEDWIARAQIAMAEIAPSLVVQFGTLIAFLLANPGAGRAPTSEGDIQKFAVSYAASREPKSPKPPSTVPDTLVSFILNVYFEVPEEQLDRAREQHLLSMAAENIVGDLLERYLSDVLEPNGWVWCAGSIVTAVDFIKRGEADVWNLLQVKNRDNSENSSSKKVRDGTDIQHWFRTFAKTGETNWSHFPDEAARPELSEDGFQAFVKNYLENLRAG